MPGLRIVVEWSRESGEWECEWDLAVFFARTPTEEVAGERGREGRADARPTGSDGADGAAEPPPADGVYSAALGNTGRRPKQPQSAATMDQNNVNKRDKNHSSNHGRAKVLTLKGAKKTTQTRNKGEQPAK